MGAAIRKRRKELGFSQEKFAQSVGIDRGRYGRIERGEVNLTLASLFSLAAELDIPPHLLVRHVTVYDCMGVIPEPEDE